MPKVILIEKALDFSKLVKTPVTVRMDGKVYQSYRYKRPEQSGAKKQDKNGGYFLGDDGKPLTVYHGTAADFSRFDESKIGNKTDGGRLGRGFYFSTDPQVARSSPRIVEAKLKIKNPLIISFPTWESDKKKLITKKLNISDQSNSKEIGAALQLAGYDAVILDYSPVGYNHKEIMVPDADQIEVESNSIQKPKSSMQAEAKKPAELSSLEDVDKVWEDMGIESHLYEGSGGIIILSKIVVPKEKRGKGIGTAAMKILIDYADRMGKQIALTPSGDFGGNKARLNQFYRSFGFRTYKGFTVREKLIRDPVVNKSLTFSGFPLQGRTKVHGMDISIENRKGSMRRGTDKDGHKWATKMHADYGYIRGTVGKDKDHLDCYVGPNPESTRVFIVHQNDPTTGKYDEDKIILAVDTPEEAKALYMKQYDRPGFFGSMDETDIETFKAKAFADSAKGKKLVIKKSEDAAIESASEVIDEKTIEFYQKFYDMMKGKDGHLDINGNRYKLKDLEGFPKGLDLENCAVMRIDAPVITFAAGGDWQQDVYFGVGLSKDRKLKVVSLYEERGRQSKDEIRTRIKVIERCSGVSPKLVVKAMKQRGSRFFTEEELRAKGAAVDVTTPPRIITTEELRMGRMLTDAELRERHAKGQGRILTEKELRDKVKRQREEKFIERRNPDELAVGVKVEMEHTDDPAEARKIAFDHLIEDRHYYKKLLAAGLVDEAEAIEEAKKVGLKKSIRLDSPKDSQGPIKITVWALQ